ncbi:hypothetical protein ACFL96_08390 [Thermoproteota archaeon]
MSLPEQVLIPPGKKQIEVFDPDTIRFKAPNKQGRHDMVALCSPSDETELRAMWDVIKRYNSYVVAYPFVDEMYLDDITDVIDWHFGSEYSYFVIGAKDKTGKIKAVAAVNLASIEEIFDMHEGDLGELPEEAKGKSIGLIYQVGVSTISGLDIHEIDIYDTYSITATKMYKAVADFMGKISIADRKDWLGVVAESRIDTVELRIIQEAGFKQFVNYWKPPAVRPDEIPETKYKSVDNIELLGKGLPRDPVLREVAAKAYLGYAYSMGQNIEPTLKLLNRQFHKEQR